MQEKKKHKLSENQVGCKQIPSFTFKEEKINIKINTQSVHCKCQWFCLLADFQV